MEHKLSKPEAILFDWDWTIFDSDPTLAYTLEQTFAAMAERGFPKPEYAEWSVERLKSITNFAPRSMLKDLFTPHGEEHAAFALKTYIDNYVKFSAEHSRIFEGAIATLKLLEEKGIPFAIVSNKFQPFLDAEREAFLKPHFPNVICLGDSPEYAKKPAPDSLFLALKKLGVAPSENVWMIGDTLESDMVSAQRAGCKFIYMAVEDRAPPTHCDSPVIYGFNSFKELIKDLTKQTHIEK